MATYVEQLPLILPNIEDGVKFLGDLWDCKISKKIGSTFDNNGSIGSNHLKVLPRREQDYRLTYIKSTHDKIMTLGVGVSATLVVLRIKMTVGSAKYTSSTQTSLTKEQLEVCYDEETFVVRLLPSGAEAMKESIRDQLRKGEISATHIVTEITLGVQILATIDFEEKVTTKFNSKTSSGLGSLIIGPMSSAVEAGLSAISNAPPDMVKTTVNFESDPPISPQPKTVKEAIDVIKKFRGVIEDQNEFEQLLPKNVFGVPIRFFLVPISQFLDDVETPDPVYEYIEGNLLNRFMSMINTLRDFSIDEPDEEPDEEPIQDQVSSYYKKRIAQADFRLKPMLYDIQSPFCQEVTYKEKQMQDGAKILYSRATSEFEELRNGRKNIEDLKNLLNAFDDDFNPGEVDESIRNFVLIGQDQLSKIQAGDVSEDVKVDFLTSAGKIADWQGKSGPFKLFVKMSFDKIPAQGILLSVYQLSMFLDDSAVALTMPNVAQPDEQFQISYRPGEKGTPYAGIDEGDEIYGLKLISVAVGFGYPVLTRLYTMRAAMSDIVLPLNEHTIQKLPDLMQDMKTHCSDISICESFVALREIILNEESADVWKFVVSVDALESISENVQAFFQFKEKLKAKKLESKSIEWIAASFALDDSASRDAPCLFIFLGGNLYSVCNDALDLLLLEFHFSEDNPDLSVLSPKSISKSCFYSARALYASQVLGLFKTTYTDIVPPILSTSDFGLRKDKFTNEALEVLIAYGKTNASSRELTMLSTLAKLTTWNQNSLLVQILKLHGWSIAQEKFAGNIDLQENHVWSLKLQSDLYDYIFSHSEYLRQIGIAFRTFEACYEEQKKINEERKFKKLTDDPEPEPEPEPPYDPIDEYITIKNLLEVSNPSAHDLLVEMWNNTESSLVEKYLAISNLLIGPQVIKQEMIGDDSFIHLRQMLELLAVIIKANEDEDNKGWEKKVRNKRWRWYKETTSEKLLAIAQFYVSRLNVKLKPKKAASPEDINQDLANGFTYKAIGSLAQYQFENWHLNLQNAFRKMTPGTIIEDIKILIWTMKNEEFKEDHYAFCWQNSKFQHLIRLGLNEPSIVEELIRQWEDKIIPPYIPPDIAAILKASLASPPSSELANIPTWTCDWTNLKIVKRVFQGIYSMNAMPPNFMSVMRENLNQNAALRVEFQACKILFYWNAEKFWFDEPWEMSTVFQAVELIVEYELNTGQAKAVNQLRSRSRSRSSILNHQDSAEVLLSFIRLHFVPYVKTRLVLQTMKKRGKTTLEFVRKNVESYEELMNLFGELVNRPSSEREAGFEYLEIGLRHACSPSVQYYSNILKELRQRLKEVPNNKDLQQHMQQVQQQLNLNTLHHEDFIREYEIIQEIEGIDYDISFGRFLRSHYVDALDIFRQSLCPPFCNQENLNFPALNIFVLSCIGLAESDKLNLLAKLFPSGEENESYGILGHGGLKVRLICLSEEQRPYYGVDAIVLLDVGECYASSPEYQPITQPNQPTKERQLVAFALATSHLTLVNLESSADKANQNHKIPQDLLDILQMSMFEVTREKNLQPILDLVFFHANADEVEDSKNDSMIQQFTLAYEQTKSTAMTYQTQLGLQQFPSTKFTHLSRRITSNLKQLFVKSLDDLYQIIQSTSLARVEHGYEFKLGDWIHLLQEIWNHDPSRSPILVHNDMTSWIESLSRDVDLNITNSKIEECFKHHMKEFQEYLTYKMIQLLKRKTTNQDEDGWDQLVWLSRNESIKTEIMRRIREKLLALPNKNCTPLTAADSEDVCEFCAAALASIGEYGESPPPEIQAYIKKIQETGWRRLLQQCTNLDLQVHSGKTIIFEIIFDAMFDETKECYSLEEQNEFIRLLLEEMMKRYSDQLTSLPGRRLLIEEVKKVYKSVAHIIAAVAEELDPQDFEFPSLKLKLDLKEIPKNLLPKGPLTDYAPIYEFSIIRKLEERVQIALNDYARLNGIDYPTPDVRWRAHLYVLQLFQKEIKQLEQQLSKRGWSPIVTLSKYHLDISEEIRKRLQAVGRQQKKNNLMKWIRVNRYEYFI